MLPVRVATFQVLERLGIGYRAEIVWWHETCDDVREKSCVLALMRGNVTLRKIAGVVVALRVEQRMGWWRYFAVMVPWIMLLKQQFTPQVVQKKRHLEILHDLLEPLMLKHGRSIRVDVDKLGDKAEHRVHATGNDWIWWRRLLAQDDLTFFFESDPLGLERLVIVDRDAALPPITLWQDSGYLHHASIKQKIVNHETECLLSVQRCFKKQGAEPIFNGRTQAMCVAAGYTAMLHIDDASEGFASSGSTDDVVFHRVEHRGFFPDAMPFSKVRERLNMRYMCRFTACGRSQSIAAPMPDFKPMHGVQIARVIKPRMISGWRPLPRGTSVGASNPKLKRALKFLEGASDDVHIDGRGRIAIQFDWQDGSDNSFVWAMVSQPLASRSAGSSFIPRVGMQVAIQCADGDPDLPVVVGCLYNEHHGLMPLPITLPFARYQVGIRSGGVPFAGKIGPGHALILDDTPLSEHVTLHSGKDMKMRAEQALGMEAQNVLIQGDRSIQLRVGKASLELHANGALTLNGQTISILSNAKVKIRGRLIDMAS